jgi:hypothetical protein
MGFAVMPSSQATVAYVFKRRYSNKQVTDVSMRDHVTYMNIAKTKALGGQDFVYGLTTGNPQGVANNYANSVTAEETLKGAQFVCTDVQKYGYIVIDGPSMLRLEANQGKLIDMVTRTTDGVLKTLGDDIAFDLMRSGTGNRGKIAAISTNTLTLTDQRDVDNFKRGMSLVASVNSNGTSPRAGSCKVTKLNRAAKQITVDNAAGITGLAVNDFLFRFGANTNSIDGMGACTPLVAPTSTLFRNVDRTDDIEALAGTRIDDVTRPVVEGIGDLAVQLSLIGKRIEVATVYPTAFQTIVKNLGAKVVYNSPGGQSKVGFQEIMIYAAGYAIPVRADADILPTETRVWTHDAHELAYLGDDVVHIIRDDGNTRLRTGTSDGFSVSARFVGNYLQQDTAAHGVGQFQP